LSSRTALQDASACVGVGVEGEPSTWTRGCRLREGRIEEVANAHINVNDGDGA
jgi:hypothetical protein